MRLMEVTRALQIEQVPQRYGSSSHRLHNELKLEGSWYRVLAVPLPSVNYFEALGLLGGDDDRTCPQSPLVSSLGFPLDPGGVN